MSGSVKTRQMVGCGGQMVGCGGQMVGCGGRMKKPRLWPGFVRVLSGLNHHVLRIFCDSPSGKRCRVPIAVQCIHPMAQLAGPMAMQHHRPAGSCKLVRWGPANRPLWFSASVVAHAIICLLPTTSTIHEPPLTQTTNSIVATH
jgi:hypothetical protein